MDVFKLRDRVVDDYRGYVESFLNILDPKLDKFVRGELKAGALWPEAILVSDIEVGEEGPQFGFAAIDETFSF